MYAGKSASSDHPLGWNAPRGTRSFVQLEAALGVNDGKFRVVAIATGIISGKEGEPRPLIRPSHCRAACSPC